MDPGHPQNPPGFTDALFFAAGTSQDYSADTEIFTS